MLPYRGLTAVGRLSHGPASSCTWLPLEPLVLQSRRIRSGRVEFHRAAKARPRPQTYLWVPSSSRTGRLALTS